MSDMSLTKVSINKINLPIRVLYFIHVNGVDGPEHNAHDRIEKMPKALVI